MRIAPAIASAFLASLAMSGVARANLVTNGSFEDTTNFVDNTGQDNDSLPGGSTAMTGWTVLSGHNVSWIGPTNPFGITAAAGSYFLDLTDYSTGAPFGGVEQTIATQNGASYSITFDLGSSSNFGVQDGVQVTAGSTTKSFTTTNNGNQPSLWELESLSFTATGSSTTIVFLGDSGANYIGLDNVAVVQTGSGGGGVPEPSSWALLLLGFGGLGFAAYRRSRASAVSSAG